MKHCASIMVIGILSAWDDVDRPVVKVTERGLEFCNFEVRRQLYDRDENPYCREDGSPSMAHHRCTAWAKHAREAAAIPCGSTVCVAGEPTRSKNQKTGEWRDEIKATAIILLAPPEDIQSAPPKQSARPAEGQAGQVEFPNVSDIINLDDEDQYV